MKNYGGKRVLVTGGAGFLGSNLVHKLVELGADVTVVDSLIPDYGGNLFNLSGIEDRIRINIADVRDPFSMEYLVKGQEYFFNLAGQVSHTDSMHNPFTDLEINLRAQLSMLEACRRCNPTIRILFASTRQVYGKPQYLPVDENHPLHPVDVNGINKLAAEQYHLLYHRVYGIPVCVLRMTNVFGPRMRVRDARQTFVGLWIRQIIQGETLKVFGDGTQLRDLNYVDDVVSAMLQAASAQAADGEIYNLGTEPINLMELARLFIEVNRSGKFELVEFPAERKAIDIGSYRADFTRIKDQLGWQPVTPLREAIRLSLEYYRQYLEKYL